MRVRVYKMVPGKKEYGGAGGGTVADPDNLIEETLHYMESNDDAVIAAFLRGIANKLDPPKTTYRGLDNG